MPEQPVDLDELAEDLADSGDVDAVDEQLIARPARRARVGGLQLTGEGRPTAQLANGWSSSALKGEITDHMDYNRRDAAGRDADSRNGHRAKTDSLSYRWFVEPQPSRRRRSRLPE